MTVQYFLSASSKGWTMFAKLPIFARWWMAKCCHFVNNMKNVPSMHPSGFLSFIFHPVDLWFVVSFGDSHRLNNISIFLQFIRTKTALIRIKPSTAFKMIHIWTVIYLLSYDTLLWTHLTFSHRVTFLFIYFSVRKSAIKCSFHSKVKSDKYFAAFSF